MLKNKLNFRVILSLLLGFIFIITLERCQCNTGSSDTNADTDTIATIIEEEEIDEEKRSGYYPEFAFFYLEFDENLGTERIIKQRVIDETIDPEFIQKQLNLTYPDVIINNIDQKDDVMNVIIEDATFLTQQMGTYGAQEYLLHVVYAFTSLPDIKAVNFQFKEGDHAEPRTYTREDWNYPIKE